MRGIHINNWRHRSEVTKKPIQKWRKLLLDVVLVWVQNIVKLHQFYDSIHFFTLTHLIILHSWMDNDYHSMNTLLFIVEHRFNYFVNKNAWSAVQSATCQRSISRWKTNVCLVSPNESNQNKTNKNVDKKTLFCAQRKQKKKREIETTTSDFRMMKSLMWTTHILTAKHSN